MIPLLRSDKLSPSGQRAVFSSLFTNSFTIGAAVLAHSIRRVGVNATLVLLHLDEGLSPKALCITQAAGWTNHPVSLLPPPHDGKGVDWRFVEAFTKLKIWSVGEELGIDSGVFLDADTLVLRDFDEFFSIQWEFGAVPDVYRDERKFASTFNTGVMAFRPSKHTLEDMKDKIETAVYPPNEGDQSFLNMYFGSKAVRLPYAYNANMAIKERSLEVWAELKDTMRILHYTAIKPFWDKSVPKHKLFTPEQVREINDVRAGKDGGIYREEVGWWRENFEDLMQEKGAAIRGCYS
ncbi:hypothetical protein D9758_003940 [Tetrapyrgos nigripes]|uniref:Nucleotide-diphospho-sugar transferase n=1 Tax=Tetrapyrgos nigripes TaxID=182062 RepID=A0A8H5GL87_9AGAR|nr:hypothetical protein D9758_003940 [Tetrapyrgos nigripes]